MATHRNLIQNLLLNLATAVETVTKKILAIENLTKL